METLRVYPPSEVSHHSHTTKGLFSPLSARVNYPASTTYSEFSQTSNTQSPPLSPTKYPTTTTTRGFANLPPATDSLINLDTQPSLTARLHRRKKTYRGPTAPTSNYSQPHDPLRAARLAWRLQEEYAEQVRMEEEQMRASSASFQRQQREYAAAQGRQMAPAQRPKRKKAVRSKWTAFVVWFKLTMYRFTRGLKNMFH